MTETGRAGKLRIERQVRIAQTGAHVLDRKQHILADQLERLELQAARSRQDWEERAKTAAVWLQRAAALDGEELLGEASPLRAARIEVSWGIAMGLSYPNDARCEFPPTRPPGGSSTLSYAVAAHRAALAAAVANAAVERAVLLVSTELTTTRTRQRAVEKRWIPRLESELATIRRKLDDQELEETLRMRWAADRSAR
jgi:V/A-type H+-transporting ATPase subunit D